MTASGRRGVGRRVRVVVALAVLGTWMTGGAVLAEGGAVPPPEQRFGPGAPAETKFVPITPCRIVNTQIGAKLQVGVPVEYRMFQGTAAQGGAATCGIPPWATALTLSITAPAAEANGYLRVGPAGQAVPNATFMNYTRAFNVTNGNTVDVRTGSGPNLRVQAFVARTHLIVDVLGYYVDPKAVLVAADGQIIWGILYFNVVRQSTGIYQVYFATSVKNCNLEATAAGIQTGLLVSALGTLEDSRVVVTITNAAGTPTNGAFYLTVTC